MSQRKVSAAAWRGRLEAKMNVSWQVRRQISNQKPEHRKKDAAILARFEELYKFYRRGYITKAELHRLQSESLDC